MTADACAFYIDEHGCTIVPECPAIAYVPPRIEHKANVGWNAGANSITELGGDLHTVFTAPTPEVGMIIGLRTGRTSPILPNRVEHGLFFQSVGTENFVQVIESNLTKTSPVSYTASTSFEIRRVGAQVTYWQDGESIYSSAAPSFGTKVVNACLYASGDNI